MFIGKVMGRLVATRKYQGLEGVKFLLIQPLDEDRKESGEPLVAADHDHRSGPGDTVFLEDGREPTYSLPVQFVPVDAAVVGVIDRIHALSQEERSRLSRRNLSG
ncbi:MAG: EutN/CcmL family microcompartment protein [bacterium]